MTARVVKYTNVEGVELCRHRDRIALFVESDRGRFEPETMEAFREWVKPRLAVLDVGAYTGLYSIAAAQAGAAEVIAIEPNPKAARRLRHNLRHNGVQDEVTVVEAAASLFRGRGKLEIGGSEARGLSSTSKLVAGDGTEVITIDDLADALSVTEVGLIKIDVEGHELAVLTGAAGILEEEGPVLIVEVASDSGGDREAEVTGFLSVFGYDDGEPLDGRNRIYRPLGDPYDS